MFHYLCPPMQAHASLFSSIPIKKDVKENIKNEDFSVMVMFLHPLDMDRKNS